MGSIYSQDRLDKGMNCVSDGTKQNSERFYHAIKSTQFKIYKLFTDGVSHFMSSDLGWLRIIDTAEWKITDQWDCCIIFHLIYASFLPYLTSHLSYPPCVLHTLPYKSLRAVNVNIFSVYLVSSILSRKICLYKWNWGPVIKWRLIKFVSK
jgi:hypothetical protein